ncbi:MAG: Hpt domain-containing protein [Candidatus Obscuribacterales bacterium]|nr:Hpt domain-containing protein [Candidatus Obscuribacterales bacterium]
MQSDLINLEELKNLYGEDSVKELLELSLSEARGLIDGLKGSIPRQDANAVAADAHQLKGMSATMTIQVLADLAYKLENAAKSNNWAETESLVKEIENRFGELELFLKSVLN